MKKITPAQTKEAATLLCTMKVYEVAEMFGLTTNGLRVALKREGLFVKRQGNNKFIKLCREDLDLAIDMYLTNKKLKEIEAALNVCDEVIKRELVATGHYKPKKVTKPKAIVRDAHPAALQAIQFNNKFLSMRF